MTLRRKLLLVALSTLALLGACGAVFAGDPAGKSLDLFGLVAPSFTSFGVRDGLPDPVVVTIRTDRDGMVWAGTQHGLAWYDGRRWHALHDPALDGYVDQLFLDHAGTLWASSRAFGLARYDGKRWQLVGASDGMTSRRIRRLVEVGTGVHERLWAVSWNDGLFYFAGGRWHADPGNAGLPHADTLAFAQTETVGGHERQWVGTGGSGLWYRHGVEPWRRFKLGGFNPTSVESLYVSHAGGHEALWISAFGDGLWRLDANGVRGWSVALGTLPTDDLYNIVGTPAPGGGEAIWAASRAGLVRIYHDQATVFDRRYGLPSNAVRGISYWRSPGGDAVLWLATENGIARTLVGGRAWTTASLLGADSTGVFGVLLDHDPASGAARLWVASWGSGLGLYEYGRWRTFTATGGQLPSADIRFVKREDDLAGQPTVWLGTRFGNLVRVHAGPRFETIPTPWPHTAGQVLEDMLSRRVDGQVEQWFATGQSGIYRRRGSSWTAFRPAGVTGPWTVFALLNQSTHDGRQWLWATSDRGLARFDGSQWTLVNTELGLHATGLLGLNLIPDAAGHAILWVGSLHHGMLRVDVTDPLHPHVITTPLPPAPDPTAYDALRAAGGDIYVCTNSGVQRLTPTAHGYASRVFSTRDGMINEECNAGAQFIDSEGRFWTGTLGGVTVYSPAWDRPDRQAKPLRLTTVTLDGKATDGSRITVPPGRHDLRVAFALLSWRQENRSQFRTFLAGFDPHAGAWSTDDARDIGALPPGEYVLHIEARDYAGNVSTPILLPITVEPEWWQHRWVRALVALVLLLLVYGVFRWRVLALHRRQRVLEAQVAARTVDLDRANRRLLELSNHDALTGLYNRRRFMDVLLHGTGDPTRDTALIMLDVDWFKQYNDTWGHPAGDVALRVVAGALRRHTPGGGGDRRALWR